MVEMLVQNSYMERKRLQVERYLNKVFSRREVYELDFVKQFLSSTLNIQSALDPSKLRGPFGFGLLDHIIKSNYERGFRIYRPMEVVAANDQEEFYRRQMYILSLETKYSRLVDVVFSRFRAKEGIYYYLLMV